MTFLAVAALAAAGAWRVVRVVGPRGPQAVVAVVVALVLAQQALLTAVTAVLFDLAPATLVGVTGALVAVEVLATRRAPRPVVDAPAPRAAPGAVLLAGALAVAGLVGAGALLADQAPDQPGVRTEVARVERWADDERADGGAFDALARPGSSAAALAWAAALGGRSAVLAALGAFVLAAGCAVAWNAARLGCPPGPAAVLGGAAAAGGALALVVAPVPAWVAVVGGTGTLLSVAVEHARLTRPRWSARRVAPRRAAVGPPAGPLVADLRRLAPRPDRTAAAAVVVVVAVAGAGVAPGVLVAVPVVALAWRRAVALGARRGHAVGLRAPAGLSRTT